MRLTEVRSKDERSVNTVSDVVYEAGPFAVTTEQTLTGFGSGEGYDATKPGFTWNTANNEFRYNGVAPTTGNSGSTSYEFRLRLEVDVAHDVTTDSEFSLRATIDPDSGWGVDRQHEWRNVSREFTGAVKTLAYEVTISSSSAPAANSNLVLKLTSLQLANASLNIHSVRIHFILPDSADADGQVQEYDLNNPVTWVFGRRLLGPALGSHTNNQTTAGVKIDGGRLEAAEDLAVLEIALNARTGVTANGYKLRLRTRIPGLQAPTTLREIDDSTNVWRIVETVKGVVKGQEFWVEVDAGGTYAGFGSPNFVWNSTRHDSDTTDNLLYPGLIATLTQDEYDALSFVNPYQVYYIVEAS